jgi:RecA/RadA recombinase
MAKEEKTKKAFSFTDMNKSLSKIEGFEYGDLLTDNVFGKIDEWIGLGNYILNAQLSGSVFGGMPNTRSFGIAGDPGTGKTFLCLNIAREAQKLGYDILYCDTEGAIEIDSLVKQFGIDPMKFRLQPIKKVSQVRTFIVNVIDMVKQARADGNSPKIMIFVDSLGMLSTDKEEKDAQEGKNAQDMGLKAKELRALFRSITLDATTQKIPIIATNHTYTGGGYMPTKESSGGDGPIFAFSMLTFLGKSQLKEGDTKTGIIVTSRLKKSRFTKPRDIKFHISFYRGMSPYVGLEEFMSWENCGVGRGNIFTEKEYSKMKEQEQAKCKEFTFEGEKLYFIAKETARTIAVRHLGKTIYPKDLFTDTVWTEAVLRELDEKIIKPTFKFPDMDEVNADLGDAFDIDETDDNE